jgi:hypothetical protein
VFHVMNYLSRAVHAKMQIPNVAKQAHDSKQHCTMHTAEFVNLHSIEGSTCLTESGHDCKQHELALPQLSVSALVDATLCTALYRAVLVVSYHDHQSQVLPRSLLKIPCICKLPPPAEPVEVTIDNAEDLQHISANTVTLVLLELVSHHPS